MVRQRGLTLIELLVALAIFAIISTIAVPIYTQYSIRTYVAEAQADLLRCAGGMERYASANFSYEDAVPAEDDPVSTDICTPETDRFTITVTEMSASTFELTATPVPGTNVASVTPMTINSAGVRGDW